MKPMLKWFLSLMSLPLLALDANAQYNAPASAPPALHKAQRPPASTTERVLYWNEAMLRANAVDHTPGIPGTPLDADQLGPTRTTRAFAIVHLAMFDAINAVRWRYPSYAGLHRAPHDTSADAALAQAAHDTLAALYPRQRGTFDALLAQDLARIPHGRAKWNGIETGRRAAAAMLALRAGDEVDKPDPVVGVDYFPDPGPGQWRPDPVSNAAIALGARWSRIDPFVIPSTHAFRAPPPPALTSAAYTAAFKEIKQLGGDGVTTPTVRTPTQTLIGIYWAYDGTARIGTPPRLYNQIAAEIARKRTTDALEMARLLALVNVAMADSCMVLWYDKYVYDFWRPVAAVREASPGSSPTGRGDGNPDTIGDPHWTPLGSPATNMTRTPNFTPPFPAYTSGHAGMGRAMFQVLRRFYGTDRIPFTFVSDELNGINRDSQGRVRPRWPRSFATLSQADEDNALSRIYLGVHWRFDVDAARVSGHRVANYVFERGLVRRCCHAGANLENQ